MLVSFLIYGNRCGIQLLWGICLLNNIRNAGEHVVEGRAVVHHGSLGVRFLQKPKFLESDDCVSAGDL